MSFLSTSDPVITSKNASHCENVTLARTSLEKRMTEEEFVALLAIEGKKLVVDRTMSRGNHKNMYKPVPYYSVYIDDPKDEFGVFGHLYRSRAYAIKKAIEEYYKRD